MKVLLILVDALKSKYLNADDMPVLYGLSQCGYYVKRIIPSPGFCERSEIFTGVDCYDSGNYCAIGYIPESSEYKEASTLRALEFISHIDSRIARYVARKLFRKKSMGTYRIPYRSLSKFALTEDGDKSLVEKKDIFECLDKAGKTYTLGFFTSLNRTCSTVETVSVEECMKRGIDFIPYYIGEIDTVGHMYGNDIESIRPFLKKNDAQIGELVQLAKKLNYSVVILGDHGMVPVTQTINIRGLIEKKNLRLHTDYEMFLDSTTARFWSENEAVLDKIRSELNALEDQGAIVNDSNSMEYRVPRNICSADGSRIYGDILWCANPGVLISPDYFNPPSKVINGMHGYLKKDMEHGTGLLVSLSERIPRKVMEELPLHRVCNVLCELLQIEVPNDK